MSYDISLLDPVTEEPICIPQPHHMFGGVVALGGTHELSISITYNYSHFLVYALDNDEGIRSIYGLSGLESIPILKRAIGKLGDDANDDYWKATEGNTKRDLYKLLTFAQMRPDCIWDGD